MIDDLVDQVQNGLQDAQRRGQRFVLGITGAPGSGKSTLAVRLTLELTAKDVSVAYVPMDGFHLADVELERLGRLARKGAADTFDASGYVSLLGRIREDRDQIVYAPNFERNLEQAIAGSIAVLPRDEVVITEGNYLLSPHEPWPQAAALIDEVWFCEVDSVERQRRLVDRHILFGKEPDAARAWVETVDEPNAVLIDQWKHAADKVLMLD